jgi:hypothetical protein
MKVESITSLMWYMLESQQLTKYPLFSNIQKFMLKTKGDYYKHMQIKWKHAVSCVTCCIVAMDGETFSTSGKKPHTFLKSHAENCMYKSKWQMQHPTGCWRCHFKLHNFPKS